ncbi:MAG: hypothetical protein COV60_01780 [Candidatus Magasanikbacteria bacterium CG11_big_fil_rev_8_21_14_0_20_43_7]|uniref:DUF1653 domain-containing protein n=1 Tax=Candidatus Magasanikbacteria bacterium CG11_big_fil_rev_8_21_14_0_20_43_7 TaxID=1974654 RepID=A0A2H0N4X3_9BACT|nr:MAG: hypothetical protein COV60_01780 [Candidatus Magasanikbacteria bacterium CG11_big_fil_rev_8_21_14_0_20_43_7]
MQPITPGIYKHYKGGMYEVIGIGRDEATLEQVVVYNMLYDTEDFPMGSLWVRPLLRFTEDIEVDGVVVPRFSRVSDV